MESRRTLITSVASLNEVLLTHRFRQDLAKSRRVRSRLIPIFFVTAILSSYAAGQAQSSTTCQLIASLPPMATFGGSRTAVRGETELGLAFGGYGELLPNPCIHAGGLDWLVRWRRGMSSRVDLGFDTVLDNQTDGSLGVTAKAALRYQVKRGFRVEAGIGASDHGDGGAVNGDFAAVLGTDSPDKSWNYYTSLRLGASRGLCQGSPCVRNHLPGALVPLGVVGATARVSENVHFVMEAGLGEIFSREYSTSAPYVHLSFGVLFSLGNGRKLSH